MVQPANAAAGQPQNGGRGQPQNGSRLKQRKQEQDTLETSQSTTEAIVDDPLQASNLDKVADFLSYGESTVFCRSQSQQQQKLFCGAVGVRGVDSTIH